jgi:hypothetical protein
LNLCRICKDSAEGQGDFSKPEFWRAVMPKAIRIAPSVPIAKPWQSSDTVQFVSVALFSGIGLLISLIAVIMGVRGYWI